MHSSLAWCTIWPVGSMLCLLLTAPWCWKLQGTCTSSLVGCLCLYNKQLHTWVYICTDIFTYSNRGIYVFKGFVSESPFMIIKPTEGIGKSSSSEVYEIKPHKIPTWIFVLIELMLWNIMPVFDYCVHDHFGHNEWRAVTWVYICTDISLFYKCSQPKTILYCIFWRLHYHHQYMHNHVLWCPGLC